MVSYSLSGDPAYAGLPVEEQLVTIADNDTAGLGLSTTALEIPTGATDSYTLRLTSQPRETVLVDLLSAGAAQVETPSCDGGEGGPCLLFTPENWAQPQTVTVRAFGFGQVHHTLLSGDGVYDGLAAQSVGVNREGGGQIDLRIFLPVISR